MANLEILCIHAGIEDKEDGYRRVREYLSNHAFFFLSIICSFSVLLSDFLKRLVIIHVLLCVQVFCGVVSLGI